MPVRQIKAEEASEAVRADLVQVMAASFLTYKPWTGMWGDERAFTEKLFVSVVDNAFEKWEVWVAEDDEKDKVLGVAMWCPPGVGFDTAFLRPSIADLPAPLKHHFISHVSPQFRALDDVLPGHDTEWWYLAFLATHPDAKGKGVGTALLQSGAERAGSTPQALSTGNDENQHFYEGRGYVKRGQVGAVLHDGYDWTERLMVCPGDAEI
ncbi:hypothetical protein CcaverHIS002_0211060 [Cutaneotrichosporon cavernicola]|uniref:N-acetyltransferase domain-containing protein n=1 Tax=Cutaneotrichosporon cavernicola TaxID=279322 RepID=A0AA48I4Z3_9TREE|nr:uncharacterized protein CcaverHIS019_0211060 [Cutaneotrichosporon cavernicola]BEI81946.1 hypothetical protein CcaverHIS002_0211060 [Cutaneotrichosporon cavernicola]BEI89744.1 hypothetical protein CcaverHIS019_0211060 [Cutaneotrichosporon cavernicola]BEI97515.1 hypothetical protein CcaverHIS631_0211040 [Cutaneotrichosporon cavernicola]BEJ05293.1 hypothetical protein CcaverHIS641_0211100 [Cutaneotrichosporon cavernicola]